MRAYLRVHALTAALGLAAALAAGPALAQSDLRPPGEVDSPLAQLFGSRPQPQPQAQVDGGELIVRLNQLESQIRQLNGQIEQLQFRNQQLEQSLKRMQEDYEFRFQELGGRTGTARTPAAAASPPSSQQQRPPTVPPPAADKPPRRSDVFDPAAEPGAPGAPRALGGGPGPVALPPAEAVPPAVPGDGPVGAPGGREFGQPLDITTLASRAVADPTLAPPPAPPVIPPATPGRASPPVGPAAPPPGPQAALPSAGSPREDYDRAYGAVLRQDHETAEAAFRTFLRVHPRDKLVPNATYWLGESLYQRQRFRDAAEQFLKISTDFPNAQVAPNALLRLGQSLAALGEREAACATFGEAGRKYPSAPMSVRQGLDKEKKRARC